jgi:hypothetical protein
MIKLKRLLMKYICPLLLPLVFILSCAGSGEKNDAITLAFKFKAGEKYLYLLDSKQIIEQDMLGRPSEIRQNMQLQSSYSVAGGDGANKKLTAVFDRFYIRSVSNGMTMEYDSADSLKQPKELSHIAALVHQPFTVIVNSKGHILNVDKPNVAAQTEDDSLNMAASKLTDSSMRNMIEQSLNIYPDKPVRLGESWQRKYLTNMGFIDMEVTNDYKLVSVDNGIAHLETKATIRTIPSTTPNEQHMEMEMSGTQSGTMDIDINTGLIQDSELVQQVSGKMKIPGAEIPMKLHSDTRIIGKMKAH